MTYEIINHITISYDMSYHSIMIIWYHAESYPTKYHINVSYHIILHCIVSYHVISYFRYHIIFIFHVDWLSDDASVLLRCVDIRVQCRQCSTDSLMYWCAYPGVFLHTRQRSIKHQLLTSPSPIHIVTSSLDLSLLSSADWVSQCKSINPIVFNMNWIVKFYSTQT